MREEGSDRPRLDPTNDHGFARRGLCARAVRAERIGCTHTMARYALREAIEALLERDGAERDGLAALRRRLEEIDLAISLLDHRKGDRELDHARQSLALGEAGDPALRQSAEYERRRIERDLERFEADHDEALDALGELRHAVLERLDQALGQTPMSSAVSEEKEHR